MWIYVDNRKRIFGYNYNNMSGNTGWQQISGDVPKILMNEHGIPIYELVDGQITPRSQEDVDSDYVPPPDPPKSNEELQAENELLRAQIQSLADRGEFIEDCIAEMAMQVYQ